VRVRSGWGRETQVLVTIGLATLLGYNDDPAHLDRYGPIAAAMARDIAAHGVWRCAVIDDVHGAILGLGKSTYRAGYVPGPALQHLTRTIYRTCAFPGCRTTATSTRCDWDHVRPWPGGSTCSCNGQPLCRSHHRMKTTGLLRIEPSTDPAHPAGTWIWTTLTGRRYLARQ